jgi:hypothetical protein
MVIGFRAAFASAVLAGACVNIDDLPPAGPTSRPPMQQQGAGAGSGSDDTEEPVTDETLGVDAGVVDGP